MPPTNISILTGDRIIPSHDYRFVAVDGGRFFAALAIIWIHTAQSVSGQMLIPICRFAVPFFTVSIVFFSLQNCIKNARRDKWNHYISKRATRLYLPFLLWSLTYLLLRLIKHYFVQSDSPLILSPAILSNGTTHHLWFLPFALFLCILAFPLGRLLARATRTQRHLYCLIALGAGIVAGFLPPPLPMEPFGNPISYFIDLSWAALPAALLGVSLTPSLPSTVSRATLMGLWASFVVLCSLFFFVGTHSLLVGLSGAVLFLATRMQISVPYPKFFTWAGSISFGIYLIHVAFVELFRALQNILKVQISLGSDFW